MSMNLYEPTITGKGLTISRKPSDDSHAIRRLDMEAYVQVVDYPFSTQSLTVTKVTSMFFVQCFDDDGSVFLPDSIEQDETTITVKVLNTGGYARVVFIGGSVGY